ncbi:MAG: hypothetical protein NUV97_01170 [archaeon]|nr:hypothetical protein [archaeon]MCR4323427.1 hypothetical protein [Nanoarchaeota archaeon]
MVLDKKIIAALKTGGAPLTQKEIADKVGDINRAVLLGYLRCLVDLEKIKAKDSGKAKIYYL